MLQLSFLGTFCVQLQGYPPSAFRTNKVRALLAYLALEAGRTHERASLIGLLWPEMPQAKALNNLSRALNLLRRPLHDQAGAYLSINRQAIRFKPDSDFWLDVAEFEKNVGTNAGIPQLQKAVALYRGEFLSGFTLPDAPAFEEWLLFRRERLYQQMLSALAQLTAHSLEVENYEQAQRQARRQLELDAWQETAHRQLMQALVLAGERNAALAQYKVCCQILAEALGMAPEPKTTLLYEQIKSGEIGGAKATAVPHHNLPLSPTPFIGRQAEIAQLRQRLQEPSHRLVTITGEGGSGKTRLALATADTVRLNYRHGVWFVPLAPIEAPDSATGTNPLIISLADALNFAFHGGSPPHDQLLTYLHEKEMLIIFDNFEHLLAAADFVSELLRYASQLKILVTSRERLNLPEEWLFPLQGMCVPAAGDDISDLAAYDALQLFAQRAGQVQPRFNLPAEQARVIRICQLVDGLPLAIELAAAWTRLKSCQVIAQEIQKSLDFLATRLNNIPERHRSLRAVFEHSWQLLSAREKAALKKLSVFRGGFREEAAESVVKTAIWQLASLVDKSLLTATPTGGYQIHSLLRQYLEEKLRQEAGEYEQMHDQHAAYYLDLLQRQESHLKGPKLKAAVETITADMDNIRAGWRWAIALCQWADLDRSVLSLSAYCEAHGRYPEAEELLGQVVTALRPHGQEPNLARSSTKTEFSLGCHLLGQALAWRTWFQVRQGRLVQSEKLYQESLALLRRSGGQQSWVGTAHALLCYGVSLTFKGQSRTAVPVFQEGIDLFRASRNAWGSGIGLLVLSQAYFGMGQYGESKKLARESMATLAAIGEQRYLQYAKTTLGHLLLAQGHYQEAETIFHEALNQRQEIRDQPGIAFAFRDLGEATRLQGQVERATEYYQQSISQAQKIGLNLAQAQSLWGLGNLAVAKGDHEVARRRFQASRAIFGGVSRLSVMSYALAGPGWAALAQKAYQEAGHYFGEIAKTAVKNENISLILDALSGAAHIMAYEGQPEKCLEILTVVGNHAACRQETKDRSADLLAELRMELPAATVTAVQTQSQQKTIEGLMADIRFRPSASSACNCLICAGV